MVEIKGTHGIIAKMLKHSKSSVTGTELLSYELTYPRIIHSELITHQMLPRNAASSRAIPFPKMVEQLGARPVRFGKANPGMQDTGVDFEAMIDIPKELWQAASAFVDESSDGCCSLHDCCQDGKNNPQFNAAGWWDFHKWLSVKISRGFYDAGFHKQVLNRVTEAHQFMKTVISGTEWNNFFWLRNDPTAADPTIAELARVMYAAKQESTPFLLNPGEWHLPYLTTEREEDGTIRYLIDEVLIGIGCQELDLTLEQAIQVSSARTAAVSFRNTDYGIDKSKEVYGRLVGDERKHGSAMAHQATPMEKQHFYNGVNVSFMANTWEPGITHVDRNGKLWSAHYKDFIQHRKLIPGENIEG